MIVASQHPLTSWQWAYGWAAGILIGLTLVVLGLQLLRPGRKSRGGALNGADNRWSTSKVSVLLWTYAVLFAFVAILVAYHGDHFPHEQLSTQYLILLGIPGTAAVAAKAITSSNVASGKTKKTVRTNPTNAPWVGIGQLFGDDDGNIDLLDSQYFAFNLVLLGYFFVRFIGHSELGLPSLPDSLLGVSGVAGAAYVGKKALPGGAAGESFSVGAGSSLVLTSESSVTLPAGGGVKLPQGGDVQVPPQVRFEVSAAATAAASSGGRVSFPTQTAVDLPAGATISNPTATAPVVFANAANISCVGPVRILDAAGVPVALGAGGAATVPAGGQAQLAPMAVVTLKDPAANTTVPAKTSVAFAAAGTVSLPNGGLAEPTAAVTVHYPGGGQVEFPRATKIYSTTGAQIVAPPSPAQALPADTDTDVAAGAAVLLAAANAESLTLLEDSTVTLEAAAILDTPAGGPQPIAATTPTTLPAASTVTLPAAGELTLITAGTLTVPLGGVVMVPAGAATSATVTDSP